MTDRRRAQPVRVVSAIMVIPDVPCHLDGDPGGTVDFRRPRFQHLAAKIALGGPRELREDRLTATQASITGARPGEHHGCARYVSLAEPSTFHLFIVQARFGSADMTVVYASCSSSHRARRGSLRGTRPIDRHRGKQGPAAHHTVIVGYRCKLTYVLMVALANECPNLTTVDFTYSKYLADAVVEAFATKCSKPTSLTLESAMA